MTDEEDWFPRTDVSDDDAKKNDLAELARAMARGIKANCPLNRTRDDAITALRSCYTLAIQSIDEGPA